MTAQTAQQRGAHARHGATYWAIFQRIPTLPIVMGSHYGVRVQCETACQGTHGHVWTSEADARARLAILPTHYSGSGAPIAWEVGRVLFHSGGYFWDVRALELEQLRPGMRVNTGSESAPYWQTIASIALQRTAPRYDVYSVTWTDSEPAAAPSLLSTRRGPVDVAFIP